MLNSDVSICCAVYRKCRVALPLQRVDGLFQPLPRHGIGRNVQQPESGHGGRRSNQFGKQGVREAVAGEAQLGEAVLELEGSQQRVEGGGGQTEAAQRHRRAAVLGLAQSGHAPVLVCGGDAGVTA